MIFLQSAVTGILEETVQNFVEGVNQTHVIHSMDYVITQQHATLDMFMGIIATKVCDI